MLGIFLYSVGIPTRYSLVDFSLSRLTRAGLGAAIISGAGGRCPVRSQPRRRDGRVVRASHLSATPSGGLPPGSPGVLKDLQHGDGVILAQRIDWANATSSPPNWAPYRSACEADVSVSGTGDFPRIPAYRRPHPPICNAGNSGFLQLPPFLARNVCTLERRYLVYSMARAE